MFTSTGSKGLYKAPLSKSLLLVPNALAVLLMLVLPQYQNLFAYNLQAARQERQVWRLICGRLICLDLKDIFCSSLLIYNFRIFERRFGSRKFASFLFGTWILTALVDFLLVEILHTLFELQVDVLPSGLLGTIFALFVPFYCTVPRVQVTPLLGQMSVTNKTLVYVVGFQLLTSNAFMWLIALSGLLSGLLYHCNVLRVQQVLFVPGWMAHSGSLLLEPLFTSSEPTVEAAVGMGATLDIQRQQQMDMLDQQLMMSQLAQFRRNLQPPQAGLLNWSQFFPSLRQRVQNHPAVFPQPQQPGQSQPSDNTPIAEEQVARLMEMGFSRVDAQEALRASNNDINMATNVLLQL
ncbi:ubiquitin-associated domain-containing protein 2 isoform X1 [Denticeps clupeoides]|uniref:ubiquitin-associated domain-containing protein 2 isoform X1 n=1 Tax=Denticeps clupeoides TaxID=299321 RepID=UPI0010A525C5|nr:ubiquitin-associated domain-containing protein 2 isoform X1 [Denticeps clupeoides]